MIKNVATLMKEASLCWGIEVLGLPDVVNAFTSFYNHYLLECVSVGSGVAIFESYCIQASSNVVFHLVDPDYLSFIRMRIPKSTELKEIITIIDTFALKPHYPLVNDLVLVRNHLVSNSTMLLNWCNPGIDYYDYDAIVTLRPVAIFAVYGQDHDDNLVVGPAGSYKFQLFCKYMIRGKRLCKSLRRPFVISEQEDDDIESFASQYKIVYSCLSETVFKTTPMIIKMSWLERIDRPLIFREPDIAHLPTIITHG